MADPSNPVPPHDAPQPPPEGIAPVRPTEIVLNPRNAPAAPRPASPAAAAAKEAGTPGKPTETKDSLREVVETVVFVVVLVLLLKTFLAEAFVIPTGSMATTLLGYNLEVTCQKCGYSFLVNASKEADPQEPRPLDVVGCTCPNCEYHNRLVPAGGGPR
jgi:Signal peptidase, peptidase S26